MLKQLSIYAENRKGTLQSITQILADAGINIWGSCTNDGAEYGINRMVVSEPEKAMEALEGAGYLCRLTSVIGVELADEVGNLNRLLQALSESNININYIYLSFNRDSGLPVMVFQTEDSAEVESCIRKKGFSVV
ncbi:MAG TPA: amino acid-binding protein [Candidatus Merdisoma faecalis]|uniref:amino acid-binding protein n=1 Tax=Lachnoclostridium sp. An138 TaxID=1965560 RepID=UPI000B370982|nr:amino acid-binding protein [Lachnoclostridium sp. An138]OUQ19273.1 amino acid-binding protein [Lachnoclostridium sp. An138]HIR97832.1 amino acid-binding protein [Candidatus Merdisoma faecalis]